MNSFMQREQFEQYLTSLLKPEQIKDFAPNGLQIQGSDTIKKIVTGVTATLNGFSSSNGPVT